MFMSIEFSMELVQVTQPEPKNSGKIFWRILGTNQDIYARIGPYAKRSFDFTNPMNLHFCGT
jgi:hypothetical protein